MTAVDKRHSLEDIYLYQIHRNYGLIFHVTQAKCISLKMYTGMFMLWMYILYLVMKMVQITTKIGHILLCVILFYRPIVENCAEI